jgi:hypothetical protein
MTLSTRESRDKQEIIVRNIRAATTFWGNLIWRHRLRAEPRVWKLACVLIGFMVLNQWRDFIELNGVTNWLLGVGGLGAGVKVSFQSEVIYGICLGAAAVLFVSGTFGAESKETRKHFLLRILPVAITSVVVAFDLFSMFLLFYDFSGRNEGARLEELQKAMGGFL